MIEQFIAERRIMGAVVENEIGNAPACTRDRNAFQVLELHLACETALSPPYTYPINIMLTIDNEVSPRH